MIAIPLLVADHARHGLFLGYFAEMRNGFVVYRPGPHAYIGHVLDTAANGGAK